MPTPKFIQNILNRYAKAVKVTLDDSPPAERSEIEMKAAHARRLLPSIEGESVMVSHRIDTPVAKFEMASKKFVNNSAVSAHVVKSEKAPPKTREDFVKECHRERKGFYDFSDAYDKLITSKREDERVRKPYRVADDVRKAR